jgi:hypothetical protein
MAILTTSLEAVLVNAVPTVMTLLQAARLLNLSHQDPTFQALVGSLEAEGRVVRRRVRAPRPIPVVFAQIIDRGRCLRFVYRPRPQAWGVAKLSEMLCLCDAKRAADIFGTAVSDATRPKQFEHDLQVAEILIHECLNSVISEHSYPPRNSEPLAIEDPVPAPLEVYEAPQTDGDFLEFESLAGDSGSDFELVVYPNPNVDDLFVHRLRGRYWLLERGLNVDGHVPDLAVVDNDRIVLAIEYDGQQHWE